MERIYIMSTNYSNNSNYIWTDLNCRLPQVEPNDNMTISDVQTIEQSLIRLISTRIGEIPYYRGYGLNLQQFEQYPLTQDTADLMFAHIKNQINAYEKRVTILDNYTTLTVNYDTESIMITVTVQVNTTGQLITLPTVNATLSQ